ncbi:MAG: hypothetical protein BMS9Abin37_1550 [Acidobacteriota bacterium]|nr:MAG: hypothetical protein BMS9Abin37_1550 [Acidobacteriota bacterium]
MGRSPATRVGCVREKRTKPGLVRSLHNEPWVSSDYLPKIRDAFDSIINEETPFVITDDDREYSFEGFTILTPEPLPGETS